jgi:hypothetical protein
MAIHGVVRTDNMAGTDVREALVSIKYMGADGQTPTEIDNGCVLKVGALEGDSTKGYEREVRIGAVPAANDELKDIVLVASPEVIYDERVHGLQNYFNEAGKICRGYHLHQGDIFSVTKEALDGKATPAVNDIVELKAGVKLNVAASATAGSTQVGKIIAIDVVGQHTYYVILVG